MSEALHWFLWSATLESAIALVVLLALRARRRAVVGPERFVQRGPRLLSLVILAGLLALALVALATPVEERALLLTLLAAGAGVLWLQPRPTDGALGASGVRHGWSALRFEDLEEWRLTGDHLRFRRRGEWFAVHVPRAAHGEVRTLLAGRAGERESRFSA